MKYLKDQEEKEAKNFIDMAIEEATKANCLRDKCGSVIIKDGGIIGAGFNSPPKNLESQRYCFKKEELAPNFKSDKTCCIHAEIRAIMDALAKNPHQLPGSRLYFARVDEQGNFLYAGKPYCTYCSKMSLDAGIAEFVLWHEEGIAVYPTEEYNQLSFNYGKE